VNEESPSKKESANFEGGQDSSNGEAIKLEDGQGVTENG